MNFTNETFYPLDYWFSLFGYPYTADVIFGYVITPIWFLSSSFSLFSLFILLKTPFFASHFFSYMRLYVANCLVLSLLGLTTILASTHQIFSVTNTYEVVFCAINLLWLENSLLLFSSCIEICLVVERVLYLLPAGFSRIKLISFKKFFFISFIFCILVNFPGGLLLEPAFADIQLDPNTPYRIWYIGPTTFSFSLTGEILNYLGYLFRDILPMILKIIINSVSIYLVGKYVKNKQRIVVSTTIANIHLVSFDRKQTYIALAMSTFSLLEHSLYIASYVLVFISYFEVSTLVYAFALLFIAIKHLLIFFILWTFNSLFRNEVRIFFRRVLAK